MICADSQRQKRLLLQRITHILLSISLSSSPRHLSSRESEGNVATAAIHEQNRYCSKCKEHVQAFKKLDLWKLPEILVVHLKRFHYSQGRYVKTFVTRDKINTVVDFPVTEVLDMGDLSIGKSPPPPPPPALLLLLLAQLVWKQRTMYIMHGCKYLKCM